VNAYNNSEVVTYLPWAFDQPNGQASQKCVSYDFERGGYNDEECTSKACFPCQLPKDIFFHVRGFPEALIHNTVDVDYILSIDVGKISFAGFSGLSSIVSTASNTKEDVWQLLSNGSVIGRYSGINYTPIGLCEWYLYNTTSSKVELKLTQVEEQVSLVNSLSNLGPRIMKLHTKEPIQYLSRKIRSLIKAIFELSMTFFPS